MARIVNRYVSNSTVLAVFMISLTAILTHGLGIASLGYYHDDWYMLWSGVSRGAASLIPLFSTDRPFMGVIYTGFYLLIGNSIIGWHLFALFFRILGACGFYWILNLVWPKQNKSLYVVASMLFVVFPGFLAQPNAATKINHLIGYGAALFSIAFTLKAARTEPTRAKWIWTGLAMFFLGFYVLIYEYMIGLEVMRIALLFWVWWQARPREIRATALKVFRAYLPYVAVVFLFLVWRIFIFDSTRGATNTGGLVRGYLNDPLNMVLRLGFQVVKDFLSASVFAWFVEPYAYLSRATFAQITTALLLAGAVLLLAAGYLFYLRKRETTEEADPTPAVMIVIGALITLGAVFPVVLSNRMLDLTDVYKGYGLHPSAGVIILLLGLALMLKPKYRTSLLLVLLAISVTTQSLNIQRWATFWEVERNFWWQVSWRAPEIADNTLVMAYTPDNYLLQQDYEIWGPLNLIYRSQPAPWPMIQAEVLNSDTIVDLYRLEFLEPHVRDIYLPKYYSHFLLFSQPTLNACVQVVDGRMPVYSARERGIVEDAGRYSSLNWIDPNQPLHQPPAAIFGPEPAHGWCYAYQQAQLARQKGDWQQIAKIYDSTTSRGLKAGDPTEYLVFIEGLVNAGRDQDAAALVKNSIEVKSAAHFAICNRLSQTPGYPETYGYRAKDIYLLTCENIDN